MSKQVNQYIEVYVPEARWQDSTVQHIIDSTTALVGGATVTKADGLYVRKDGTTDEEQMRIVHWDFSHPDYAEVTRRVAFLVEQLFDLGEECVLLKRVLGGEYTAELLYAPPKVPLQHQPPLPLDAPLHVN